MKALNNKAPKIETCGTQIIIHFMDYICHLFNSLL